MFWGHHRNGNLSLCKLIYLLIAANSGITSNRIWKVSLFPLSSSTLTDSFTLFSSQPAKFLDGDQLAKSCPLHSLSKLNWSFLNISLRDKNLSLMSQNFSGLIHKTQNVSTFKTLCCVWNTIATFLAKAHDHGFSKIIQVYCKRRSCQSVHGWRMCSYLLIVRTLETVCTIFKAVKDCTPIEEIAKYSEFILIGFPGQIWSKNFFKPDPS